MGELRVIYSTFSQNDCLYHLCRKWVKDPRFLVCIKCSSDTTSDDGIEVCFGKKFTEGMNLERRNPGNNHDPYEAGGGQITISPTEVCNF